MTHQTPTPIKHATLSPTSRSLWGQVHLLDTGEMTLAAPYQRESVWSEEQRIMLIKSLMSGIPIPALIINERNDTAVGQPGYAVVDGKQRLLTLAAWLHGELAVPASWWPPERIVTSEETADGPYVRFTGLDIVGQRWFKNMATIAVVPAKAANLREEAELFLLVNSSGTGQTEEDLQRARDFRDSLTNRQTALTRTPPTTPGRDDPGGERGLR